MKKNYISLKQDNFDIYLISMSTNELITKTVVKYYDSNNPDDDGYQRPLVPSHYRKIAKYLSQDNPILPPAILTAADPINVIEQSALTINGVLRVVDGQHRIEGIRYLKKTDEDSFNNIKNYEFPVIVMVIKPNQKVHEIETFININSKGKRVSTDLAIQLRDKIRDQQEIDFSNNEVVIESIATKVSNSINNRTGSLWYENIRLGDESSKGRPISVNAFNESLKMAISNYVIYHEVKNIKQLNNAVELLTKLISDAWNIITDKWGKCFSYDGAYMYSKRFNIQKGIGVIPLHTILGKELHESKGDIYKAKKQFKQILSNSKVKSYDWVVGGKFSVLNSKGGFNLLERYIKNEDVEKQIIRMSMSLFQD